MKLKDIEQMERAGLITPDQAAAIAEHFKLSGNRMQRWLLICISSLAGALILAGIIMLISANWATIPDAVKMGTGIALMVGFWLAYGRLRGNMPMLAETMGFLGGGMWLANIALYGQIFQLQNPFVEGCALFFCGIVLLPFLAKQRLLIAAVIITSFVLLIAAKECDSSVLHLDLSSNELLNCIVLLGIGWWLFGEYCHASAKAAHAYAWVSIPLSLSVILFAQGAILYGEGFKGEPIELAAVGATLALLLVCKPKQVAWLPWIPLALFTAAILPVADICDNIDSWMERLFGITDYQGMKLVFIRILYCFVYALLWIWCGCNAKRISWINYGCILVCFAGIGIMSNMLDSLTESGLTLIAAGVTMLAGAIFVEKQRRRLIRNVKAENNEQK